MSTTNDNTTVEALHQLMTDMMNGIPNLPSTITALTVGGKTYTMTDLKTQIGTFETVFAQADAADNAAKTARDARNQVEQDARVFMSAAVGAFKAALGKKSPALTTVGINPNKTPAPPTLEQKQERTAKAQATRKARGTMGPKQKAKIHGQVPPAQTPPAQGH